MRRWELTDDIDFGKALEATEQILLRRNRRLANNGDQSRPHDGNATKARLIFRPAVALW
jgi:hypothetical protein